MPDPQQTKQVQAPDGTIYEVPASATDQQMIDFVQSQMDAAKGGGSDKGGGTSADPPAFGPSTFTQALALAANGTPLGPLVNGIVNASRSELGKAADWLPATAGAVGGTVGLAGGLPGAVAGAAAGGATGEAWRQLAHRALGLPDAPTSMGQAAAGMGEQAAVQGGSELAGAGLTKLATTGASRLAEGVMQSAAKPTLTKMMSVVRGKASVPPVVTTLLREGVNVTPGGVQKLNRLLESSNQELTDILAPRTETIALEAVADRAEDVVSRLRNQVNPTADVAASKNAIDEFLKVHGGVDPMFPAKPMSVQEAQALKVGTYKALGARAYGEVKGATTETEKALARGLKEEIEQAVPDADIKAVNARIGQLQEARDVVGRQVAMAMNRNPGGLAWLTTNPDKFLAFMIDRSPLAKSLIARGLYKEAAVAAKLGKVDAGANLIRMAVGALSSTGQDEK